MQAGERQVVREKSVDEIPFGKFAKHVRYDLVFGDRRIHRYMLMYTSSFVLCFLVMCIGCMLFQRFIIVSFGLYRS